MLQTSTTFVALLTLLHCARALPDTGVLIVGAGTSGCAFAARLCDSLADMHITFLERAEPRSEASDFTVRTPRSSFDTLGDPDLVELMHSEPEPSLANRVLSIATGATLGGSGSVNGMKLTEFNVAKYILRALNQLGAASQQGEFRQIYVDNLLNEATSAGFYTDRRPLDRKVANTIFENRVAVNASGAPQNSFTAYLTPVENSVCANNFRLVQGITVTRVWFKPRRQEPNVHPRSAANHLGCCAVWITKVAAVVRRFGVGTQAQARALATHDEPLPPEPIANHATALSQESIARWPSENGGALGGRRAQSLAGRAGAPRRDAVGEGLCAAHGLHLPRIPARDWAAPRGASRRRGHARVHRAEGGVCDGAHALRPAARHEHHAHFRDLRCSTCRLRYQVIVDSTNLNQLQLKSFARDINAAQKR
ncbi:Glucose-methanol-choline oxidoreductase [Gracilaria domingensis]|nr:Glucose-methanol-choline oxidoreductase [Gracilaria domingensis]